MIREEIIVPFVEHEHITRANPGNKWRRGRRNESSSHKIIVRTISRTSSSGEGLKHLNDALRMTISPSSSNRYGNELQCAFLIFHAIHAS